MQTFNFYRSERCLCGRPIGLSLGLPHLQQV